MILVSIQPFSFAPRKLIAILIGIVSLASLSCFASPLFLPVDATPYDHQMSRIRPVLVSNSTGARHDLSIAMVNAWIGDLREIPYGYHVEWRTPSEVQSGDSADCKGKAVALYQRMQASGATNVRLVIGKRSPASHATHAWLLWQTGAGDYILDPTFNWTAYRASGIGRGSYLPYYAFAGGKKYRVTDAATLYANN